MDAFEYTKMAGTGNDFVFFDARGRDFSISQKAVMQIADRKHGLGCDGVMVVRSASADYLAAHMQIFNADGSDSAACGNALRCLGLYLNKREQQDSFRVTTDAGEHRLEKTANGEYRVSLKSPSFAWQDIPLAREVENIAAALPQLMARSLSPSMAVNVGNPHLVSFVDPKLFGTREDWRELCSELEVNPLFPERVNVGIATAFNESGKDSKNRFRLRVWERGVGFTKACGSGACAMSVAARVLGLADGGQVQCIMEGGTLKVDWEDKSKLWLSGAAEELASGQVAFDEAGRVQVIGKAGAS